MSLFFNLGDKTDFRVLQQDDDIIDAEEVNANPGDTLRNTISVYGGIFAVAFFLFCVLRRKYPRAYNIRGWAEDLQCDLAQNQFGYFSWMWNVYAVSEEDILEQCGMDALCFIRILEFGFKISFMGVLNSIWLFPVYRTAYGLDDVDRIIKVTIANIPEEDIRVIVAPIAAWIMFGYTMFLLLKEFEWFIGKRHTFLRQTIPRNYAIYVSHIDPKYRSSPALFEFFKNVFGEDAILEAHVAMDIPDLESKVAERDEVIGKLEHAINVEDVTGKTPTHKLTLTGTEKVNSIDTYADELKNLNDEISDDIKQIEAMNYLNNPDIETQSAASNSVNMSAFHMDATDQSMVSNLTATDPYAVTGTKDSMILNGVEEESGELGNSRHNSNTSSNLLRMSANAIGGLLSKEDGAFRESGFVVFKKLSAVHAALQMVHHHTPFTMDCEEAPNPDDIFWQNVGKTHKQLQVGKLLGFTCTVILCLFWTVPVAFVTSISNVAGLKEQVPFLADWIEKAPWLEPMLEVIAPLFIVILQSMLPAILLEFVKMEGPISTSVMEASLFGKLGAFMIIQTFFVASIGGAVLTELQKVVDDPESIITTLAETLPGQSTFYVQILLVRTFLGLATELLRPSAIVIAWIRGKVGPNLTEKERNTTWMGLRPLSDPLEFEYASGLADSILYFMVTFVYTGMAPFTNYFLSFCYLLLGSCYRHQLMYIYPTTPDSGGRLWLGFINIALTCMMVAEFTLFGYLGLKKVPLAVSLMIPLIIVTLLFNFYIRQQHFHLGLYLPSADGVEEDLLKNKEAPLEFDFVKDEYLQAAMRKKVDKPDNYGVDREIAHDGNLYHETLDTDDLVEPVVEAEKTVSEQSRNSIFQSFTSKKSPV
mmetsp:Transcript_10784/g.16622  ORF Transcript_10784/g.16622 Transcript_10784/m.16622 type:complete len:874 (+) Transcript_10784:239-2860(+)|eukprot:CAMPEP_0195293844 /NCGR_PEP_ID=MMETSP0707-20130614/13507_1 /TAXON_ID=33640 /ORGANISM="Asterionellopsis glacialis, Strain CCMP134" /LENGTH=873 /DNA_ID=CAMNT_0040354649 /DNA_START=215 /DNA_END=2836 /DNA_ORIENTATION=+